MPTTYRKVGNKFIPVGKKKKSGKAKKARSKKGNVFAIAARDKSFRAATKRFNAAAKKKSQAWKAAVRRAK